MRQYKTTMSTVFDQVCTVCTYTRTPMVTPGEGRAERLSTHFDSLISEKYSNCVVIDFICPLSICFVSLSPSFVLTSLSLCV